MLSLIQVLATCLISLETIAVLCWKSSICTTTLLACLFLPVVGCQSNTFVMQSKQGDGQCMVRTMCQTYCPLHHGDSTNIYCVPCSFDVACDKGTFDAIGLAPDGNIKR